MEAGDIAAVHHRYHVISWIPLAVLFSVLTRRQQVHAQASLV